LDVEYIITVWTLPYDGDDFDFVIQAEVLSSAIGLNERTPMVFVPDVPSYEGFIGMYSYRSDSLFEEIRVEYYAN
jgi:hypothetical protein